MTLETKMLATFMVVCVVAMVYAVLKVTSAWYDHHVSRHDLIAESKRRRYEYLRAVAERERELAEAQAAEAEQSVIIEDEEPVLAQAA